MKKINIASALGLGLVALGLTGTEARADQIFAGTVYYTHYTGGQNVWDVTYNYDQTTQSLTIAPPTALASVNGADGIIFDANNHLLVGGQTANVVHMLQPNGAFVADAPVSTNSYHLALSPTGNTVYTSTFGGPLISIPLSSGGFAGPATTTAVSGSTNGVTQIAFAAGKTFYDNSQPNGFGSYGLINLGTGVTTQLGGPGQGAAAIHGMILDPFTGLLTFFGGGYTATADPTLADNLIGGSFKESAQLNADFDQGAVDGFGHAFIAGNNELTFLDYSISHDITHPDKVVILTNDAFIGIDDVAPLSGPGSQTGGSVPEPAGAALLGVGLAGLFWRRRKRSA